MSEIERGPDGRPLHPLCGLCLSNHPGSCVEYHRDIVISVERIRCGPSSRLGPAKIIRGERCVMAHHESDELGELAKSLSESGHPFRVEIAEREVSILDWYGGCG